MIASAKAWNNCRWLAVVATSDASGPWAEAAAAIIAVAPIPPARAKSPALRSARATVGYDALLSGWGEIGDTAGGGGTCRPATGPCGVGAVGWVGTGAGVAA